MKTPEPTQEKHKCEQDTFCVECGRDNRPQPTSDWAEQRGNLLANFALGYPPIDILDSAYLAGLDASKPAIAQAKEEGRREERQFILNILDGVDIADKQSGNSGGGTKAIRHALQSRIITTPSHD